MTETSTGKAQDDALRGPLGILLAAVFATGVSLLPMIPAVRAVIRVGPVAVGAAMAAFIALMIVGAFIYRFGAKSRAYSVFDRAESATIQAMMLGLVYAAGSGDSLFWVFALVHIFILGGYGTHYRFNYALFVIGPSLLALAIIVGRGDVGAAVLSLAIGALGLYVYWLALTVSRKLAATDAERARLAAELAETRVREERERIARDIHDGLGADLAALDWRLRGLRSDAALKHEVDDLVARLGQGAAELRTIVWALRTPPRSWAEVVAYIRQRAQEMCGDKLALELVDEGGDDLPGERAVDYMRAVLELVRNAVRHSGATELRVMLRGSTATVEDNGKGVAADVLARGEGGLANLRKRGDLVVETPSRLRITVPLAGLDGAAQVQTAPLQ
jgi:signal transduction histidine kinase